MLLHKLYATPMCFTVHKDCGKRMLFKLACATFIHILAAGSETWIVLPPVVSLWTA